MDSWLSAVSMNSFPFDLKINKEEIYRKGVEWRKKNTEKVKGYANKYARKVRAEKVLCDDCGQLYSKIYKKKHEQSKRHIAYIEGKYRIAYVCECGAKLTENKPSVLKKHEATVQHQGFLNKQKITKNK